MAESKYALGKPVHGWEEGKAKTITIVVTEDCNLVCKYCYITGKNKKNRMTFEVAKKAVDYILSHPEEFPERSVVWDFIGGEPFLEIDLIDRICDYIKMELFRLDHKWFDNYKFSFSSNGLLYNTPKVQRFIAKNKNSLSIGLSIDGNKLKHDLQRIKPDGSGSYEEIVKNVPLWLEQFPNSTTKATFASADLPHLKDSIISLWELGIKYVPANVIFENEWQEGDDLIYEEQLKSLADYVIENRLWEEYNTSLFSETIGHPLTEGQLKQNWCGAGKMLAVDYQGKFYPCVRFVDYSLNKREAIVLGDVENGYDHDKVRPFLALDLKSQSTDECINCQVASGCAWCQGFNYDEAKIDTIYERATYICKMHQARVRANDYYWNRLKAEVGLEKPYAKPRKKFMYFILSDQSTSHCIYEPTQSDQVMSNEVFRKGIERARQQFQTPVLLMDERGLSPEQESILKGLDYLQVQKPVAAATSHDAQIPVYEAPVTEYQEGMICLLLVTQDQLVNLQTTVLDLFKRHFRINLVLKETEKYSQADLDTYKAQLDLIADYLLQQLKTGNELELNVLSDRLHLQEMANCNAGIDSYALAPDGNYYVCPAFYFDPKGEAIGTVEQGIAFTYQEFLTAEKSPLCSQCDAYHCRRCVYHNKLRTREYLIPAEVSCVISHLEREVSQRMLGELPKELRQELALDEVKIEELAYVDPLTKII